MKKYEKPCFPDSEDKIKEIMSINECGESTGCKKCDEENCWEGCKYGKKSSLYKWYKTLTKCPWCGGELK